MKQNAKLIIVAIVLVLGIIAAYFLLRHHPADKHPDKPLHGKTTLTEYFSRLFPTGNWYQVPEKDMEELYLGLDCWYTEMIPKYEKQIITTQPHWNNDRMHLWRQKAGTWEKLFDGSLCDCMRFAFPNCTKPKSRFGGADILKDCPLWPGLNVGKTQKTVLTQAFNTNNADPNFIPDSLTKGGKGFPNHAWFEGLAYPGEYGHPVICGKIPDKLAASQPGLQYEDPDSGSWQTLNLPFSEGPWFDSPCKRGKCAVDFLKCVNIRSDGQFPEGQQLSGEYCVEADAIQENYDGPMMLTRSSRAQKMFDEDSALPYAEELNAESARKDEEEGEADVIPRTMGRSHINFNDCSGFPHLPCKSPDADGFHGLWLYPLRGVGMWRNIGNSVVANTKLGYLISPAENKQGGKTPLGAGYDLEDMLALVGKFGGGPQNINLQFKRLTQIIQYGHVRKTRSYPSMSVKDLQSHGYQGGRKYKYYPSRQAALKLIEKWYKEGYTGIGSKDAPNGFNYNYQKHFPIGCQFGYAAAFDPLVLATMVKDKVDTLQLIAEPQAAKAGLRPAYIFEIFQSTPSKNTKNGDWNIFKDTNSNQCKSFYMVDPMLDIDNYLKYGYVSGAKVHDPEVFDPYKMTLTAVEPVFHP